MAPTPINKLCLAYEIQSTVCIRKIGLTGTSFEKLFELGLSEIFLLVLAFVLITNVSIERLDARSKIRKKLLHSNDVARGAQAIDT